MSVNIFGLRLPSEYHARWKNGHPHQNTTGVEKASPIQLTSGRAVIRRVPPLAMSTIVRTNTGSASAAPHQKRRRMSISSGLGPESSVMTLGSRAMPQIGQAPG